MRDRVFNLAIETASRHGTIALGRRDELLTTAELPQKRRHNIELTPAIDRLSREYGIGPGDLGEIYLSLGPGSFTGLRIAIATAKMLAMSLGVKLVGVPTLDALRRQHPGAMVCLNIKRDSAWCAGPGYDASLRSLDAVRATGLPIVGEAIDGAMPPVFNVEQTWAVGRDLARRGRFSDPAQLAPLYIREPEAVALWNERQSP